MILEARFAEINKKLNCDFCVTSVQNTNEYIEKTFVKSVNGVAPDENGNVEVAGGGGVSKIEPLIFTGAVNAVYDGSTAVVADIPQAEKGDKGDKGDPGVFVGTGDMPAGYYIQIDPSGDNSIDMVVEAVLAALPAAEGVAF